MDRPADAWSRKRESQARRTIASQRVVTIGGGTGPFALLSQLKRYPCAITAIVTMSDSGGSSRASRGTSSASSLSAIGARHWSRSPAKGAPARSLRPSVSTGAQRVAAGGRPK